MTVDASHFEQSSGQKSWDNAGYVQGRPESSQSNRQLSRGIEVCRHENNTGNETTLKGTDQSTSNIESSTSFHEGLESRNETPAYHERGQHGLESIALGEENNRELGEQETQDLDRRSVVVIISRQPKVSQKIVCEGITDISSIQL